MADAKKKAPAKKAAAKKPAAAKKVKVPKVPKEKKVNPLAPTRTMTKGETVKCVVTGETVSDAVFVGAAAVSLRAATAIRGQLRKRQRDTRKAKAAKTA